MKALKAVAGCALIVWGIGVGVNVLRKLIFEPDFYVYAIEPFIAGLIGLFMIVGGLYVLKGVFRDN